MQQIGIVQRRAPAPVEVPLPLRFLGKLVLEVLPAAAASVIGVFLLAYCWIGHATAVDAPPPMTAAPASPHMVQLVRDEHSLIRDFLVGQDAATQSNAEAADDADIRVAADAKNAMPAAHHPESVARMKPPHSKAPVIAAAAPGDASFATAQLPPMVIAGAQPDPTLTAPPPPARASLLTKTLAVPVQVVAVTLHAVMAIGGIPSWIGHRVGADELDSSALTVGTAS